MSTTSTNYSFFKPEVTDNPPQSIAGIATAVESIDSKIKTNSDAIATKIDKTLLTTKGDIIYASDVSTPARLGKGTTGNVLKQGTDIPEWGTLSSDDVGALKKNSGSALPTADATYRGQFFIKLGATTVADELYICQKNASDAYVWTKII